MIKYEKTDIIPKKHILYIIMGEKKRIHSNFIIQK